MLRLEALHSRVLLALRTPNDHLISELFHGFPQINSISPQLESALTQWLTGLLLSDTAFDGTVELEAWLRSSVNSRLDKEMCLGVQDLLIRHCKDPAFRARVQPLIE